jgi:low affinity Fe/Cu permease
MSDSPASVSDVTADSASLAISRGNERAREAAAKVHDGPVSVWFTRLANYTAHAAGRPATFAVCCLTVVGWAVTGPLFHYSDTWQLVINTGTTIVTFLMVFLIQNTQNRDGAALQAKLDELIRASHDARNAYMGIEKLPESKLEVMREQCADSETPGESSGSSSSPPSFGQRAR